MEIRKKLILMQKIYNFLYNHQNLPFSVVLGEKIEKKLDNICKSYIKSPDFNPKSLLYYKYLPKKYKDEVFRLFLLEVLDYPLEEVKKLCECPKKILTDENKERLNRIWEEKSLSFLNGKYEKQGFCFSMYKFFHPKVKNVAIQLLEYIMYTKFNKSNNLVILENIAKAEVFSSCEILKSLTKKEIFYRLILELEKETMIILISRNFGDSLERLQNDVETGKDFNAFISIWDKIQIEKLQKPLLLDDKIEIIKDSAPGFLRRNPYIYENLIKIHTTGEEIEKIFDLILLNFEKEEEIVVKLKFLLLGSIEGKQTSREKEKYFYQKYHKFPDIIRAVYVKWN